MVKIPVTFDRPVEVTDVTGQERAKVTSRTIYKKGTDSISFDVPQNCVWYVKNIRMICTLSGAVANRLPFVYVTRIEPDGIDRDIIRCHTYTATANQTIELFMFPGADSFNDGTSISNRWLCTRPLPSIPLLPGDLFGFGINNPQAGDSMNVSLVVDEVIT